MKLKKYSKYKNSWIDWIWEIPEDWQIMKIKHFAKTVAWWTPSTANESFWEGNIPWLPSWMVHDNIIEEDKVFKFISFEALNNSSTKWIKPNSVLIALTWATCWNISYLPFKATANQSVIWIETNKVDSIYLFYYLLTQKEQILINQTWWAQWWINQENVRDIFCSIPLLENQQKISSFLDSKTSQIEKLIKKDRNLIELLKEKRVSLINQAVTKWIKRDIKMKESWVEWIWEIPESWKIMSIRRIANIVRWASPRPAWSPLYFDWNYINWITVAEVTKWINEKYLYNTESFLTKEWSLNSRIIKVNTLLLSNSWATLWVPKITKIKWCINDGSVAFLDLKNIDINFLFYYFSQLTKELRDIVQGSWQPNLNTELVKDLKIWLSSLEEQQEIVDFLDKETVKIDSHIKKVERRIDLYEEYKKSIIYNVVTGKVEV